MDQLRSLSPSRLTPLGWALLAAAALAFWAVVSEAATVAGPTDGGKGLRHPRPFADPYRDGVVLVTYAGPYTPDQLQSWVDHAAATGAYHVTLPIFGCQSDPHSADVGSCDVTTLDQAVDLARLVIKQGLEPSFLPIIVTKNWDWRGVFDPVDSAAWFKAYGAWMARVAVQAQALGMKELVIGSEFTKLYRYEAQWRGLADDLHKIFKGPLVITVNWGDLNHSFWDAVDAIGVSAYYPLSQAFRPKQAELNQAWSNLHAELLKVSAQWHRPIHITEVGYPSLVTAAREPWKVYQGASPNPTMQAACFEAFSQAWSSEKALVRVNIWAVTDPADPAYPISFDPVGKAAAGVVSRFFLDRASIR